jgi:hypothetical protein
LNTEIIRINFQELRNNSQTEARCFRLLTTETSYEQTNMKIQTFIYALNSFLAVCYLGTLNSKTRRPTEIICSTINELISNVSTSFKIYHTILSYFYITLTIFYYNTVSLKRTFFPVLVKGLYQTESFIVLQIISVGLLVFEFNVPR